LETTAIDLFAQTWEHSGCLANAKKIMDLNEIKEWFKDNVGNCPDNLGLSLANNGFKPICDDGTLVWALNPKTA
jgi:hypothetical protein